MASIMQTKRKSYLQNTNARMSKAKYNTDYFLNEATRFWWAVVVELVHQISSKANSSPKQQLDLLYNLG